MSEAYPVSSYRHALDLMSRWRALHPIAYRKQADQQFEALFSEMADRPFFNFAYLRSALVELDGYRRDLTLTPDAAATVAWALFFHRIPGGDELQAALRGSRYLAAMGEHTMATRVFCLITTAHIASAKDLGHEDILRGHEGKVIHDIVLSLLLLPNAYATAETTAAPIKAKVAQFRMEHRHLSSESFYRDRLSLLTDLQHSPRIFTTARGRRNYEISARQAITHEIGVCHRTLQKVS